MCSKFLSPFLVRPSSVFQFQYPYHHLIIMADESDEAAAIVSTAHLLLRGLIPAFVGCSIGSSSGGGTKTPTKTDDEGKEQVRSSAFQMTYRKDLIKFGTDGKRYKMLAAFYAPFVPPCAVAFAAVGNKFVQHALEKIHSIPFVRST